MTPREILEVQIRKANYTVNVAISITILGFILLTLSSNAAILIIIGFIIQFLSGLFILNFSCPRCRKSLFRLVWPMIGLRCRLDKDMEVCPFRQQGLDSLIVKS